MASDRSVFEDLVVVALSVFIGVLLCLLAHS